MIPVNDLTATIQHGGEIFVLPILGIDESLAYVILQGRIRGLDPLDITYAHENPLRKLDRSQRFVVHYVDRTVDLPSKPDEERELKQWEDECHITLQTTT